MIWLMLVGSYASASTVAIGHGVSWPRSVTGVGPAKGTITSVSLSDGSATNGRFYWSPSTCQEVSNGSSAKRGCAVADNVRARISPAAGNLAIVLGVELDSAVLLDKFHLNVRREDANGKNRGSLNSGDLTAVPIPAAAWLFVSALVGLTVVARRSDRKAPLEA
jgi:hypothetical protein